MIRSAPHYYRYLEGLEYNGWKMLPIAHAYVIPNILQFLPPIPYVR
jgi:hypothetical protein